MNFEGSIAGFFYNLVPGILWLYIFEFMMGINILSFKDEHKTSDFNSVLVVIIGLFLGFVFQGLTKFARSACLNQKAYKKVMSKNDYLFEQANKFFKNVNLIRNPDVKTNKEIENTFYLMDNYLRGMGKATMLSHFTARLAFWSNILFGSISLIFLFLTPFNKEHSPTLLSLLIILVIFSGRLFYEYLWILYESVLQTFMSIVKINKEHGPKK